MNNFADPTTLVNCRIVNAGAGSVSPPSQIEIHGGRLSHIRDGPAVANRKGQRVIDVDGAYIIPGLIDAHVHVMAPSTDLAAVLRLPTSLVVAHAKAFLEQMLERGFTTVRDAGGADGGLAVALQRGLFVGPRLLPSGRAIAQSGGQGDFRSVNVVADGAACCDHAFARVADGVDDVRRAARDELRRGASQLKILAGGGIAGGVPIERSHFSLEELGAVVAEASAAGTYAMAHAYAPESIIRAVSAGVRTIEHGNLLNEESAARMKGRAFLVPTLSVYEGYQRHSREIGLADEVADSLEALLRQGQEAVRICEEHGVELGFGTDLEGVLHQYQSREFILREAVQDPARVLLAATEVNARILQMETEIGRIAPGYRADLVVLRDNPLDGLETLSGDPDVVLAVMKEGRVVHSRLNGDQEARI